MSTIKLKHSGGNSVSLNPPTSAPTSSEVAFKLPNADGSANQVIKTDGSGNLGFTTPAAGKFASYAIIGDQKANDSNGGTATSGAWRTRDLNTEFADEDGIVSISSNQFTLQAGTYFIRAVAPGYQINRNLLKLQNITDSSLVGVGRTNYFGTGEGVQGEASLSLRFTISGAKTFEIQHYVDSTKADMGFGIAHNFGSGLYSIYTMVEIFKEA